MFDEFVNNLTFFVGNSNIIFYRICDVCVDWNIILGIILCFWHILIIYSYNVITCDVWFHRLIRGFS